MRNLIRLDCSVSFASENRTRNKQIRSWVTEGLQLSKADTISINEMSCSNPNCLGSCSEVETVVVVFRAGRSALRLRIGKCLSAVTREDFDGLM